jgi:hypothetical protein
VPHTTCPESRRVVFACGFHPSWRMSLRLGFVAQPLLAVPHARAKFLRSSRRVTQQSCHPEEVRPHVFMRANDEGSAFSCFFGCRVPHPFTLSLEGLALRLAKGRFSRVRFLLSRCAPHVREMWVLRCGSSRLPIYWLRNSAERSRNTSSISFFPSPKSNPCLTGMRSASICTSEPAASGFTVRTIR